MHADKVAQSQRRLSVLSAFVVRHSVITKAEVEYSYLHL
ncbi:hypothetical protein GXM_02252 [Nostoc sphaeroides CCNUC1]|uniref:Uncharacterized protein n=1 Tax=Nostoc sphaeroides CCNUC1 TaxID=2653204 RepID=A0A5P8VWP7_9NOSO|nr:hypothetical protein GXM_02252 [Nostoc sphaeroides CCNUC1]